MLEPFLRTAAAVGLNLDASSSKALADSLDRAVVSQYCGYLSYVCFVWVVVLSFAAVCWVV